MGFGSEMLGEAPPMIAVQAVLVDSAHVRIESRDLHVRDVVDLGALTPAVGAKVGSRVIARLPAQTEVVFTRTGVAALVRRAVPGLRLQKAGPGSLTVLRADRAALHHDKRCYSLAYDLEPGTALDKNALATSACAASQDRALGYDRMRGRVIARERLTAGTPVGRIFLPAEPSIGAGDKLSLTSAIGPVVIERAVVAMQPGRSGRKVFVKDDQGHISAVRFQVNP